MVFEIRLKHTHIQMCYYFSPHPGIQSEHVAFSLDSHADLRPVRHLPRGLSGGSGGLPPGVVHQRDAQTPRGGEEHSWTEGGEETAGTSRDGRHASA